MFEKMFLVQEGKMDSKIEMYIEQHLHDFMGQNSVKVQKIDEKIYLSTEDKNELKKAIAGILLISDYNGALLLFIPQ